jgi:hypothetical protein
VKLELPQAREALRVIFLLYRVGDAKEARMNLENDHLTPEDFFEFIDQGGEGCCWGPVERHLMSCPECL